MPTDDVHARLESELTFFRAKVLEAAEEARGILAEDLEVFVTRKVKEAFLADAAKSSVMSDARLAELKRVATDTARRQRDAILAALADEGLWLEPGDGAEPRGLAGNPRVWAVLGRAGEAVLEVARAFQLAAPDVPPAYQEPKRFIHSRLLTTVTERYWNALQALQRVRAQMVEMERAQREDELSRRWDET